MRIDVYPYLIGIIVAGIFPSTVYALAKVDRLIPEYREVVDVSGNLSSVGSGTMANLMVLWAKNFEHRYPSVKFHIQTAGSSTAPKALNHAIASLGPMSRKMEDTEIRSFELKYGYKPTPIRVAIDVLAVFVNKNNPLKGLTIPQVDAIFSVTRKCGYPEDIGGWVQLGLAGAWKTSRIRLFGRSTESGTHAYFRKKALCTGNFKPHVNEHSDSAAVVQSVNTSLNAIGYSGIGYVTPGVKVLPLARRLGEDFVPATAENAVSGKYPLTRYLYIYVNKQPDKSLSRLEKEFIKSVLSYRGQLTVVKSGFIPLPAPVADKERMKLD